jgi:hypothetical protein
MGLAERRSSGQRQTYEDSQEKRGGDEIDEIETDGEGGCERAGTLVKRRKARPAVGRKLLSYWTVRCLLLPLIANV